MKHKMSKFSTVQCRRDSEVARSLPLLSLLVHQAYYVTHHIFIIPARRCALQMQLLSILSLLVDNYPVTWRPRCQICQNILPPNGKNQLKP